MTTGIRIRTQLTDGVAEVKTLMKHDMETGARRDAATGELVSAHYITEITCQLNGQTVMTAYWGPAIAKNPYFAFKLKQAQAGDTVSVSWVDNRGETDSVEATLE